MEVVIQKVYFILIVVLAFVFLTMPVQAQPGCYSSYRWTQLVTPSPACNACAPEMTTTFDYDVWYGLGGYTAVHCIVINSGWDRYYSPVGEPNGHGQKIDTYHCTNLKNHQLQIGVTVDIDPDWKFGPHYLQADYKAGTPTNPEP
jgi:hypothetical protein